MGERVRAADEEAGECEPGVERRASLAIAALSACLRRAGGGLAGRGERGRNGAYGFGLMVRAADDGRAHDEIDLLDLGDLIAPQHEQAVGIVRLDPVPEETRRYRETHDVGRNRVEFHTGEPARIDVLAYFDAQAAAHTVPATCIVFATGLSRFAWRHCEEILLRQVARVNRDTDETAACGQGCAAIRVGVTQNRFLQKLKVREPARGYASTAVPRPSHIGNEQRRASPRSLPCRHHSAPFANADPQHATRARNSCPVHNSVSPLPPHSAARLRAAVFVLAVPISRSEKRLDRSANDATPGRTQRKLRCRPRHPNPTRRRSTLGQAFLSAPTHRR